MVVIRRAVVGDAEALTELHLDVWDEAYGGLMPQRVLDERRAAPRQDRVVRRRELIAAGEPATWVAEDEAGRLLGFAVAGRGRDEGDDGLELMAVYVRTEAYGTGLGHALLHAAVGDRPAYLWVLDGNDRAISFYVRHGFRFDGRTKTEPFGLERRMVRP